ncbi:UPF2 [Scenedesmus sp. PABB004]|nr:UPF2 [Scenedesmus sp. PABB004]
MADVGGDAALGVSVEAISAHTAQLAAATAALRAQREARASNLSPARPAEGELGRLDSSIKKNGAFIRKLRGLSADGAAQLLAEAAKLNLSRYVSEAVAALAEAPLKAADVPAALDMAAALHARALGPAVAKAALGAKGGGAAAAEDERLVARRQRGALRLLPELIAAGIVSDAGGLLGAIRALVAGLDFGGDRDGSLHAASLLGGFIKSAAPLLLGAPPEGLGPGSAGLPAELAKAEDVSSLPPELAAAVAELQAQQALLEEESKQRYQLPPEQKQLLGRAVDRAFEACSAALVEAHQALLTLDRDNAKAYATKGELPEGAAAEYEASRKAYELLHRATAVMAEALRKPLPELAEDAFSRIGADDGSAGGAGGSAGGGAGAGGEAPEHVFEDPETRAFYEQLPDLWSLVPTVLLRDATRPQPAAAPAAAGDGDEPAADGGGAAADAGAAAAAPGGAAAAAPGGDAAPAEPDGGAAAAVAEHPSAVDVILARLPSSVSRDLCDELAVNFCYSNSKGARKKLVRALVDVPRGNLQLLPYYARVAATVSQAYPEVGAGVQAAVEAEFDALASKKDLTRAGEEPRLRVARYLAELAKFRLAPPSAALARLKALLDDFSGPAVDAAAALVESAGRFLLRLPESRVRMENLLAVMMRLRNARNLDSRQSNAVDSAYYACRPPDKATQRRRRPPMQEYVRHLVFDRLADGAVVVVLKKLLKLPWAEAEPYLLKCLLKVSRLRVSHIGLVASLAGGLAQYHDSLGVALVDLALEDVRWGLDHPAAGNYQQRLAQVRLLGECYNYMLLDSRAVFDVLYLLIGHGHESEEAALRLDPPDDFFRVRLVIALLATCGSYFSKGAARRRLDRFLVFMQAYVLAKQPLPLDVDADLQDTYDQLRPGLPRFASYADAATAVGALLAKEAAASASGLAPIDEDDDEESESDDAARGGAGGGGSGGGGSGGGGGGGSSDDDDGDAYDRGAGGEADAEFEAEYAALLQECQGRAAAPSAAAGAPAAAAAASSSGEAAAAAPPEQLRPQQQPQLQLHTAGPSYGGDGEGEGGGAITFKLLMRRGGKDDRSREIHVPADAAMAVRLMAKQRSEAAERSAIKALVLEANQRDEAEERAAAAAEAARLAGGRAARGGRARFQPPGGARGPAAGPQLTLRGHVAQLTGQRALRDEMP